MAFDRNFVLIVGNLTQDPELRYTPNGNAVAQLNLATNRSYKDRETDEWKQIAEYHRAVAWGKAGEIIAQNTQKGDKIHIEGRLQTRKWDDNNGVTRYMTEIIVNEFILYSTNKKKSSPKPPTPNAKPEDVPEADTSDEDLASAADEAFGLSEGQEKTGMDKAREQANKIKADAEKEKQAKEAKQSQDEEIDLDEIPF